MRTICRAAAFCVAAMAIAAASALADEQIGNVVQRHYNGALGLRPTTSDHDDLYFNRDVFAGELVRTPAMASTVIRFQDKTQIQVGSNSSLTIDKFVYDPSSGTGAGAIKFGTGIFRFITGSIKNKGAVLLTTPTAALAIRGTTFVVAVAADGSTTVGVIDGEVDVAPCGNSAVARENAGQAVRVTSACDVGQVAMSSVPTDPATISDYAVDENGTGITVGGSPGDHRGSGIEAAGGPRSSGGAGSGNGSGTGNGSGGATGTGAASGSSGGSMSAGSASASSAASANVRGGTANSSASANASANSSASVGGSGSGNANGNNSGNGNGSGSGHGR